MRRRPSNFRDRLGKSFVARDEGVAQVRSTFVHSFGSRVRFLSFLAGPNRARPNRPSLTRAQNRSRRNIKATQGGIEERRR